MLSTQHTIPRIELFLNTAYRAFSARHKIKVKKIETDQSLAIIQACQKTFNCLTIKTYLRKCWTILHTDDIETDFTVHHLCSAHVMRDFIRNLKGLGIKISKQLKKFIYRCFRLLQQVSSLNNGKFLFRQMLYIFLSEKFTPEVQLAIQQISRQILRESDQDDIEKEEEGNEIHEDLLECVDDVTIKEASPFEEVFQREKRNVKNSINEISNKNSFEANQYYCPRVITLLLDKNMYLFPMWTSVLLNRHGDEEDVLTVSTTDTNAPVENWFKSVKHDMGLKAHERPAKVVVALRASIHARIKETEYPGCRAKKTTGRNRNANEAELAEEIWRKKEKKTKATSDVFKRSVKSDGLEKCTKNHTELLKHSVKDPADLGCTETETIGQNSTHPSLLRAPFAVPKWGGQFDGHHLANTCTIDNGLTILFTCFTESDNFRRILNTYSGTFVEIILTVFHLMNKQEFAPAKLVWTEHTSKLRSEHKSTFINLYGDEFDFFVKFFDQEWRSTTSSVCLAPDCPAPLIESKPCQGVNISLSDKVESVQELLSQWLTAEVQCTARPEIDSDSLTSRFETKKCHGIRTVTRTILKHSPILIIRVYEHCLSQKISQEEILNSDYVGIKDSVYVIAGITLHRDEHYCAVVKSARFGTVWYDGLHGKFTKLASDLCTWSPCHVILCQVF